MEKAKEPRIITIGNNEGNSNQEEPQILEEIVIEELSIDGICGVY